MAGYGYELTEVGAVEAPSEVRWHPLEFGGLIGALLLTAAFSAPTFLDLLSSWFPWLPYVSMVTLQYGLPGPFAFLMSQTVWPVAVVEVLAAGVLLLTVFGLLRRRRLAEPGAGALTVFWAGWGALVLGAALAGFVRGAALGGASDPSLWTTVYGVIAGLVAGALWGIALGSVVGLGALAGRLIAPPVPGPVRVGPLRWWGLVVLGVAVLAWFVGDLSDI